MKLVLIEHAEAFMVWDVSTPNQLADAYLALFREFDLRGYYPDDARDKVFIQYARLGDVGAAQTLLQKRKRDHAEYEDQWQIVEVK